MTSPKSCDILLLVTRGGAEVARRARFRKSNIRYGSEIHIVEADKRQRKPNSSIYRDAWELILQWAASKETLMRSPVKFGEAADGVIPSQA